MWRLLACFVLANLVRASVLRNGERSFSIYEIPENIIYHGYPAERHHVTTEDGYILEMHRVPRGRDQIETTDRPVAFLMHGLMSSSNAFVGLGPNSGIAYNLADAGFDVWMGNARGTRNSRRHVSLNPDDDIEKLEFFNFSWEEIGMIDVPTMLDYALNLTGKETLHYIGHSQGGTAFLVLNSMRPEYNAKFLSVHLLAGVGYMNHFPESALRPVAAMTDMIYALAVRQGIVEVYPTGNDTSLIPGILPSDTFDICAGDENYQEICNMLPLDRIIREDNGSSEPIFHVGGAALKQIAHYGQNIRDRSFRRWMYNTVQNEEIYGQSEPPLYNLSLITANVTMHYTLGDRLLDERDVLAMAADMPNTVVRRVANETFDHGDFISSEQSRELVTDYVINAMLNAESEASAGVGDNNGEDGVNGTDGVDALPDSASSTILSSLLKVALVLYSFKVLID